jgi:hypothetical protein
LAHRHGRRRCRALRSVCRQFLSPLPPVIVF